MSRERTSRDSSTLSSMLCARASMPSCADTSIERAVALARLPSVAAALRVARSCVAQLAVRSAALALPASSTRT